MKLKFKNLIIASLAFFVLILLIMFKFVELKEIATLLIKLNLLFFALAFLSQFLVFSFITSFYRVIEKNISFWNFFKISRAKSFVDIVIPSFSLGGSFAFYYFLKRKIAKNRAFFLISLDLFLNFLITFLFFIFSLIFLFKYIAPDISLLIIGIILLIAFVLLTRILWTKTGQRHFKAFVFFFLKKKPRIKSRFLKSFNQLTKHGRIKKKILLPSFALVILTYLFRLLTLALVFLSIGYKIDLLVLIVGYFISVFISAFSYIKLGVYEAIMALTYTRLGVGYEIALTATLIYRLIAFWIPLLIGFLCFRNLLKED